MVNRRSWAVLMAVVFSTAFSQILASDGVIYFNRIPSFLSPVTLHRANADGSSEQSLPVPLPSALNPAVSRDGRFVLVTSGDPGRPFKLSNNVFAVNTSDGSVSRLTAYEDIVRYDNFFLTNDLGGGNVIGDRNVRGYSINYPFSKAPAPDNSRVVTVNLQRVGTTITDAPRTNSAFDFDISAGGYRAPIVEVFNAGNPAPFGQTLALGAERTGYNQGGDGVDWHPSREEIVVALRSDIPATSNPPSGPTSAEGTVLAVFSTTGGLSPFQRKLTAPSGTWFAYADLFTSFVVSTAQHDYAPAISPDGSRVAYARHTQRTDTRVSLAPLAAICEIRVLNYDGTGDHPLLQFAQGLWTTHLAWSPDGSEIAFDLAPQIVLNGFPALAGDSTLSEIHVLSADGTNPHRVIASPASYPSWAPGRLSNGQPVQLQVERLPDRRLRLRSLGGNGNPLRLEASDDLVRWDPFSALDPTQGLDLAPDVRHRFYRVVQDSL